jgi:hypothetical protein
MTSSRMNSHILTRPRSSRADLMSKSKNGGISRQMSKQKTGSRVSRMGSRNLYSKQGGLRRVLTATLKFKDNPNNLSQNQDLDLDSLDIPKLVQEDNKSIRFYLEYSQYVQRNLDFCYKLVKQYIGYHFRSTMGKIFEGKEANINLSEVRQRIKAKKLLQ